MENENDTTEPATPDATPEVNGDAADTKPQPETQGEPNPEDDAEADKSADMAARLDAIEATLAELSQWRTEMMANMADNVMGGGDAGGPEVSPAEDVTPTDDEQMNGTYMSFDDLYKSE